MSDTQGYAGQKSQNYQRGIATGTNDHTPARDVQSAIAELIGEVSQAESLIEMLEGRLQPVSRSQPPAVGNATAHALPEGNCPMSGTIYTFAQKLSALNKRMAVQLDLLQV